MTTIMILLCIGLAAGMLSGFVGVGGGIIIVPALVYFLSMSQLQAQGTSLAVLLLPVGVLVVYNYHKQGLVDIQATIIIALTFLVGGFIGSKMSISVGEESVKKIFGTILLIVALKMIIFK